MSTPMIDSETVKNLLRERLDATDVAVRDDSAQHAGHQAPGADSPGYFTVAVVSPRFAGKTKLQQHRMVYDCLREELQEAIHALSIRTAAPAP